jgi:hypothetical protein
MKEEQYLIERVGKENPFRVPEGYFDTLVDQVMERVDASSVPAVSRSERKARVVWLRPVLYAAASVCALFLSVTTYQYFTGQGSAVSTEQVAKVATVSSSQDAFDEAADYVMIDNQEIYACLMNE